MQLKRVRVRSEHLHGALCLPDAPGPHPAVVVVGGSEGRAPELSALMLANQGFAALAVAYFGAAPLPRHLEEIPLEYFARAFDWFTRRPEVATDGLSIVGRSRGGELALLLAAHYPAHIKAVVAYAPSSVAWQSVASSQRAGAPAKSSWTRGGAPVPFVPAAAGSAEDGAEIHSFVAGKPIAFRPFFERAMEQRAAVAAAAIPVEHIGGPVLLLSGGSDQMWPSATFCELATQRLEEHGHPFARHHLSYAAAGHLLGIPGTTYGPHAVTYPGVLMGGSQAADEHASKDCWPAVVDFLRTAAAPRASASAIAH